MMKVWILQLVCVLFLSFQAVAQQPIFCVINTGSCLRIRSEASIYGRLLVSSKTFNLLDALLTFVENQ